MTIKLVSEAKSMTRAKWLRQPSDLTPLALKHWKTYAPTAYQRGTLTPDTAERFKAVVRLLALASKAAAEIEANGVVLASSSGTSKPNPAIAVLIEAQDAARHLLDEFLDA